jgi:outer membrane protein
MNVFGMKGKALATFVLMICCAQASIASERVAALEQSEKKGFLYGAGLIVSEEPYRGYDTRVIPIPVLGYVGERLRVYGPFVSYDVLQGESSRVSLRAAPRFQGFDESDSDFFEGMKDRDSSVDAGLGFNYDKEDWKFEAAAMFDTLGKSDGYELSTRLGRVFRNGPIFLEPSLAFSYLDDNNVDYYYGVRESEQTDSRLAYKGDSTVNTTIGFSVSTPILFGGFTQFAIDHTWNGSNINDSPLINSDSQWSVRMLFSKFF